MSERADPSSTRRPVARAQAREMIRERLSSAARDLFAERGFDHVTVDEITEAAGVSRRTFFRHFPTKEDAIFGQMELLGRGIAGTLASCPDEMSAWAALRVATRMMFEGITERPAASLRLYQML